ncbi:MAG: substrate-binding domain-containing protein, partial [Erysipelotrichaceae bacterium]
LVGYDDISIAKYLYPKLTTIRQPMEQIAHHAVEMLLERMESGVNKKVKVLLDNELIIRETTKEVEGK